MNFIYTLLRNPYVRVFVYHTLLLLSFNLCMRLVRKDSKHFKNSLHILIGHYAVGMGVGISGEIFCIGTLI